MDGRPRVADFVFSGVVILIVDRGIVVVVVVIFIFLARRGLDIKAAHNLQSKP